MINRFHATHIKDLALKKSFVVVKDALIGDKLMNGDTDYGYAVQSTIAESVLAKSTNFPVYRLLKESLVPGYSVYLFNYKSPYLDRVNLFLLFEKEFGLSRYNSGKRFLVGGGNDSGSDETIALSLDHLQSCFYILLSGCVIALLVFILEIYCFKRT